MPKLVMPQTSALVSANNFLYKAASVWGIVWLLAISITLTNGSLVVHNQYSAFLVLAVEALLLVALFFIGEKIRGHVLVFVAVAAIFNSINVFQSDSPSVQLLTTTWLNVATIVMAFISPDAKRARFNVLLVVAISAVVLIFNAVSHNTIQYSEHLLVLPIAYALAVGLAAAEAASAVRETSLLAEKEASRTARTLSEETAELARQEETDLVARLLHDTVINTLGAIRRGISASDIKITQERCLKNIEDIQASFDLTSHKGHQSLYELFEVASSDSKILSLKMDLISNGTSNIQIPAKTFNLIRSSIRETLTNINKHSQTKYAEIKFLVSESKLIVEISDFGCGFDPSAVSVNGGFNRSVIRPCETIGGRVNVFSKIGSGTKVISAWPIVEADPHSASQEFPHPMSRYNAYQIALNTARWLIALAIFEAALFTDLTAPLGGFLAIAILVSSVFTILRIGKNSINIFMSLVLALGIMFVNILPVAGIDSCRVDQAQAWGVDGAAALVVLLCLLGPKWFATISALIATLIGLFLPMALASSTKGCLNGALSVLPIEIGTIAVVTIFRNLLERLWRTTQLSQIEALESQKRFAANQAVINLRNSRLEVVLNAITPIMQKVGAGRLDPNTEIVRNQAERAETALRSLLLIDKRLRTLGDFLSNSVIAAFKAGASVRIVSGEYIPDPNQESLNELNSLLSKVTSEIGTESSISLGLFDRGNSGVLTILISGQTLPLLLKQNDFQRLGVQVHDLEDEKLLEVSWISA